MDDYQNRSYGEIPVGFGEKPGIVVVDFQVAFTDPQYPLGGAPLVMRAVENTAKLLEAARRHNVPVASCNTAYMNEREMRRYVDVVDLPTCLAYLEEWRKRNAH
jgi:maleamate amidohydrolase